MNILIIDDKSNEENYPRKIIFHQLKDYNVDCNLILPDIKEIIQNLENKQYDLIIVDYFLYLFQSEIKLGTSLFSIIRTIKIDTPIYLTSVVAKTDKNQIGDFDFFITDDLISDEKKFVSHLEDHCKLKNCQNINEFLRLLNNPDALNDDLEISLRPIFNRKSLIKKENHSNIIPNGHLSLNLQLFKWIVFSLVRKDGPLVSKLGASILLGVSETFFDKISQKFDSAKYDGLFSNISDDRWWAYSLKEIMYAEEDQSKIFEEFTFSKASSLILGATKDDDFSICPVCEKRYPNAIGLTTDDSELHPVHVLCSDFDDNSIHEALFKTPRIINK